MTDAELTYGALDFLGDLTGSPFHALADMDIGAPQPLVTAVPRLLLDGEPITHERDSNRDLTFRLEISGDDPLALNEAEADLVREVNKPRNTLRWKPPGMNTPVTVFETFAGFVSQVFDDLEEMRGKRVYTVTLPALPHARSETLVTTSLEADFGGVYSLTTGGSVRTPGTLRLTHPTDPLGTVLVATWPDLGDDFRPDVARLYSSGTRTIDATNMSGYSHESGTVFQVPNTELAEGPYSVFIKTEAVNQGTVTITFQTVLGAGVGAVPVGPVTTVTAALPESVVAVVPVGIAHLPSSTTPAGSAAVTEITVTITGTGGGPFEFDEVLLFRNDGQLTWLEDLDDQGVWLESPSVDQEYGAVWVSPTADVIFGYHPGEKLRLAGQHIFDAPTAAVYVATTGAAPALDLLHYHRWHSNAAD